MQDSLYRRFFLEPHQPLHRRYEALRAVLVDGQPQVEVAKRFGYTYNTLRHLVSDFRAQCRAEQVPPFSCPRCGVALPGGATAPLSSAQTMHSLRMCGVSR
jgi:Homeodomain-like domain